MVQILFTVLKHKRQKESMYGTRGARKRTVHEASHQKAVARAIVRKRRPKWLCPLGNGGAEFPDDAVDVIVEMLDDGDLMAVVQSRSRLLMEGVARKIVRSEGTNARQTDAIMRVLLGQSLFLTGMGGVGKSFVVRAIVYFARLAFGEDAVAVAASTSSAANQLATDDTPIMTLHSLLGAAQTQDTSGKNVYVPRPSEKLRELRFVVVDEVSMVTSEFFEILRASLHPLCQIVATGDLLQLPPIGDTMGQTPFVFHSRAFRKLRVVELVQNLRAAGEDEVSSEFRRVQQRLRLGEATMEDMLWLREHSRQVPVTDNALFVKNKKCKVLNQCNFNSLTAPIVRAVSRDVLETQRWEDRWTPPRFVGGQLQEGHWTFEKTGFKLYDDMESAITGSASNAMFAQPLTNGERSRLKPPPLGQPSIELEFKIGLRVVLTRAIWASVAVEGDEPTEEIGADETGADENDVEDNDDADTSAGANEDHSEATEKRKRVLVAANGEVGSIKVFQDEGVLVEFAARTKDAPPREVLVRRVAYRRGCEVDRETNLQRIWARMQYPLEIGYARTAHKAQGISLTQPAHVNCTDVIMVGGRPTPSIIYVLVSRAQSISQLQFSRDEFNHIFDVRNARPAPEALRYQTAATGCYRPLCATLAATGKDDSGY